MSKAKKSKAEMGDKLYVLVNSLGKENEIKQVSFYKNY